MYNQVKMFVVALLLLTLMTGVILILLANPDHPLSWILLAFLILTPFIYRRFFVRPYLEWRDEYSVGIQSIDQQHKKLIRLINSMQTAVNYSAGVEFERAALDELVDYTRTHFSYEEELMQNNGYPDFTTHRAEHELMIARVEATLREYPSNQDKAMQDAVDYLCDWLFHHICGTDKQYSKFLIERGVT